MAFSGSRQAVECCGGDSSLSAMSVSAQKLGCRPVCRVIIDRDLIQPGFALLQADQGPEA